MDLLPCQCMAYVGVPIPYITVTTSKFAELQIHPDSSPIFLHTFSNPSTPLAGVSSPVRGVQPSHTTAVLHVATASYTSTRGHISPICVIFVATCRYEQIAKYMVGLFPEHYGKGDGRPKVLTVKEVQMLRNMALQQ